MCPNDAQKIKSDLFTEIERPHAQIPALKLAQTEQIQTEQKFKQLHQEWHEEFHNKKKGDNLYRELASISPIKNPDGVITHFVAIKEDITQRKHAETELSESKQQQRDLSNYLQDVRETARKQLAREIHDELEQLLSLLKVDLYWIEKHEKKSLSKRWTNWAFRGKTPNLNKPINGF